MSEDNVGGITRHDLEQILLEMEQNTSRCLSCMSDHFKDLRQISYFSLRNVIELFISSELMKEFLESHLKAEDDKLKISKEEIMHLATLAVALKKLKTLLKEENIFLETQ